MLLPGKYHLMVCKGGSSGVCLRIGASKVALLASQALPEEETEIKPGDAAPFFPYGSNR